jgi:hypothetical protein
METMEKEQGKLYEAEIPGNKKMQRREYRKRALFLKLWCPPPPEITEP